MKKSSQKPVFIKMYKELTYITKSINEIMIIIDVISYEANGLKYYKTKEWEQEYYTEELPEQKFNTTERTIIKHV